MPSSTPAGETTVQGIKMEVGIEDCLHIEFEFDKQKYHLQV
jgi:vacuolar protein sorting-associated protein 26